VTKLHVNGGRRNDQFANLRRSSPPLMPELAATKPDMGPEDRRCRTFVTRVTKCRHDDLVRRGTQRWHQGRAGSPEDLQNWSLPSPPFTVVVVVTAAASIDAHDAGAITP